MLIRKATPYDVPLIRALEQQVDTAAHWGDREYDALSAVDSPPRLTLVAAEDDRADKIHGFVIARCGIDDWEIENIVVAQERRQHGVGGALVQEMLQKALQAGATAVSLEVRESNRPARVLYEKLGFSEAGRRRDYYRNPSEDALLLRISIAVP